jgi:hypothetical protein
MVTSDQLDPADMYFMSAECRVSLRRRGGGPMTLQMLDVRVCRPISRWKRTWPGLATVATTKDGAPEAQQNAMI